MNLPATSYRPFGAHDAIGTPGFSLTAAPVSFPSLRWPEVDIPARRTEETLWGGLGCPCCNGAGGCLGDALAALGADPRAAQIAAAYPRAAQIAEDIVQMSDRLRVDPFWISNVINFESGFNPQAKNPVSTATGLIQFIESTARRLGTTTATLRGMTARDQLRYVESYFRPYAGRMRSQEDVYMVVFYPAAVGKPDFIFSEKIQAQNPGIRTPRDYARKANARAKLAVSYIATAAGNAATAAEQGMVQYRWWIAGALGMAITVVGAVFLTGSRSAAPYLPTPNMPRPPVPDAPRSS